MKPPEILVVSRYIDELDMLSQCSQLEDFCGKYFVYKDSHAYPSRCQPLYHMGTHTGEKNHTSVKLLVFGCPLDCHK